MNLEIHHKGQQRHLVVMLRNVSPGWICALYKTYIYILCMNYNYYLRVEDRTTAAEGSIQSFSDSCKINEIHEEHIHVPASTHDPLIIIINMYLYHWPLACHLFCRCSRSFLLTLSTHMVAGPVGTVIIINYSWRWNCQIIGWKVICLLLFGNLLEHGLNTFILIYFVCVVPTGVQVQTRVVQTRVQTRVQVLVFLQSRFPETCFGKFWYKKLCPPHSRGRRRLEETVRVKLI